MTQATREYLLGLIARIDELMPLEPAAGDGPVDYETFKARQRELDGVVQQLVNTEGARHGHSNGVETLRLAGVLVSCTSGPHGLLRGWQRAAQRKIEQLGPSYETDKLHRDMAADPMIRAAGDVFSPYGSGPAPIQPRKAPK